MYYIYISIPYLFGVRVCPGDDVGDIGATGVVPTEAEAVAVAPATQSGSPFLLSRMISFGEPEQAAGSFSDRARQRLRLWLCSVLSAD